MMSYFFARPQFLIGMPGGTELVLILLIVLLFFGGRKIPGLMRGLGKSVKEFNDARNGGKKQLEEKGRQNKIGSAAQKEIVAGHAGNN